MLVGCHSKRHAIKRSSEKEKSKTVGKRIEPYRNAGNNRTLADVTEEFVVFEVASTEEYLQTFSPLARQEMRIYGIPASITLAQGLLESGMGRGELAKKTNNHFGIKCHTGWEGDYDFHDDDALGECFRKYNHPRYSYRDHSLFLTSRPRYAFLFEISPTNYKKWAHGLRKAGYATDRRYPQKLIALIEQYELYRYDRGVQAGKPTLRTPGRSRENTTYEVQAGDTLYSISRKFQIPIESIKASNQLRNNTISVGQRLTIGANASN